MYYALQMLMQVIPNANQTPRTHDSSVLNVGSCVKVN